MFRELYLDGDMGHGIGPNSNFGIMNSSLTPGNVMTYIVARASTFFQAILSGSTATYLNTHLTTSPFIHNVFENSCNKRKKCELFNTDGMSGDDCLLTF